jgi:hypothetical protein
MAKYYGIGGKRKGSVGNETYAINKGENIVKSKIIQVNDAKTPEQVEQRSKLQNAVKAYQDMTPDFLKKCFEDKKQKQSTYNAFVSHNAKMAQPFFKKYSDDKNVIGIGKFQVSYGSLQNLPIVKTADITVGEKKYKYFAIELNNEVADDANVGAVSAVLMNKYGIKSGSLINGVSIYNTGVSYNANDDNNPITLADVYSVKKAKNNFIVNSGSEETLASKGFKIVKTDEMKYLVLLEENSATNVAEGCIYETDNEAFNALGYCAYFVSLKEGTKIMVSNSVTNPNKHLEDLIAKINENPQMLRGWLSTIMKIAIITSYGIKKVIEIIRDWPI